MDITKPHLRKVIRTVITPDKDSPYGGRLVAGDPILKPQNPLAAAIRRHLEAKEERRHAKDRS